MNAITKIIAQQLHLPETGVDNTIALLDLGCTIPFIARYRKERTGNLNEVQIGQIADAYDKLKELEKRKETILKTIGEQGKLTDELEKRIKDCWEATVLEDLYLPYKPKRRTRAQVAREQGLEPLATLLLLQREPQPEAAARRYVKGDVADVATALKGAQDIIAEMVNEDERSRNQLRQSFRREAIITSKVVKAKAESDEAAKYSDYFDFSEPLRRCSSHRLLAMRRGESEGILRVSIGADDDDCVHSASFCPEGGRCFFPFFSISIPTVLKNGNAALTAFPLVRYNNLIFYAHRETSMSFSPYQKTLTACLLLAASLLSACGAAQPQEETMAPPAIQMVVTPAPTVTPPPTPSPFTAENISST